MKLSALPIILILGSTPLYAKKDFTLKQGQPLSIICDTAKEEEVVNTAVEILKNDLNTVLEITDFSSSKKSEIVIATIGRTDIPEKLNINVASLPDKKQAYSIYIDKKGRLVILGSDSHGTAYGIIELTRLLDVSPWEWWADVTAEKKDIFRLKSDFTATHSPSVEYRGIFINDEDWGILPWSNRNYEPSSDKSDFGPRTYEKIFELMLRLRANTCWPAMHEVTKPFFLSEGNKEAAGKYGIYIGSSHCEPMVCNAAGEWNVRGNGHYDYVNNSGEVYRFWEDRVKDVSGQNNIYTLGMRGVHDGKMQGAKTLEEQKNVLIRVIEDQRNLIKKHVSDDVESVPQTFIPYKEVLDIYNQGLDVPEDVTLMWCDDNYGYIRHFPTEAEKARKGGNGVYFHTSYWGRPHDYLWIGTTSPALIYQQMNLAYDKGIQKMWILNVGDIKPCEYQTELFLDLAWDIEGTREKGVKKHLENFLSREFGESAGKELLPVMEEHYRLSYIRKPEFLGNTRVEEQDPKYKIVSDLEWSEEYIRCRLNDYSDISDTVDKINEKISPLRRGAYYQLVRYPVLAAAEMNNKLLYAQLARHGKADADKSNIAYENIIRLTDIYNNEKWEGIMDFRPRRLPVFNRIDTDLSTGSLSNDENVIIKFNGADASGNNISACESLGYEGKAALIKKGKTAEYSFENKECDSVTVELRFLPSHPVNGESLSVTISYNNEKEEIINYETKGRSEEWKLNVLRNQAIRRLTFPSLSGNNIIRIKALDEGCVLDQIFVYENK